jgi:uncharacterized protein (DUF4415 family)
MMNDDDTRRYSADALKALRAREGSRTDLARLGAQTEAQTDAAIAEDPDWKDIPRDWHADALPVMPGTKRLVSLRLDSDVLDFFRGTGKGYQTRMNAVLRAYMRAARGRAGG